MGNPECPQKANIIRGVTLAGFKKFLRIINKNHISIHWRIEKTKFRPFFSVIYER